MVGSNGIMLLKLILRVTCSTFFFYCTLVESFIFLTTCYCSVILRLTTATPILDNGCSNITLIVQRTHKQCWYLSFMPKA